MNTGLLARRQLARQNHERIVIDNYAMLGIPRLTVEKGVFRPDLGILSPRIARYLYVNPYLFRGKVVCDMGCGCGTLSLIMALGGAQHVYAIDRNPAAVDCSAENARSLGLSDQITAVVSDLLGTMKGHSVPQFDLVVFDRPFLSGMVSETNPITYAIVSQNGLLMNFIDEVIKVLSPSSRLIIGGLIEDFKNLMQMPALGAKSAHMQIVDQIDDSGIKCGIILISQK